MQTWSLPPPGKGGSVLLPAVQVWRGPAFQLHGPEFSQYPESGRGRWPTGESAAWLSPLSKGSAGLLQQAWTSNLGILAASPHSQEHLHLSTLSCIATANGEQCHHCAKQLYSVLKCETYFYDTTEATVPLLCVSPWEMKNSRPHEHLRVTVLPNNQNVKTIPMSINT